MGRPPLRPARLLPPTAPRAATAAGLVVATGWTLAAVAVVLGGLRLREGARVAAPAPAASERIVLAAPRPAPAAPVPRPRADAPATPRAPVAAPRALPAPTPAPVATPATPAPRIARDSAAGARPARVPLPAAGAPLEVVRGTIAPAGAPVIEATVLDGRITRAVRVPQGTAGFDSAARDFRLRLGGSLGTRIAPTAAERDAAWRAASMAMKAGTGAAPLVTAPGGGGGGGGAGVNLNVGLPGGGPSNAQRRRDRAVHAENVVLLDRLRLRADSVAEARRRRTDSLARADSLRGARGAEAPAGRP
jgi:translation initiation factor IF-2